MWKSLWRLIGTQSIGTLDAQFYESGKSDQYYVTASFSSINNPPLDFAILLPLLYQDQIMTLVDPYAKNLANNLVSLFTHYKSGSLLSTLLPPNVPTANIPLVFSSRTVLQKKRSGDEYYIDFFPEFILSGDKDAMVARFLWALLPWAVAQIEDADLLAFVLAHLDLISNVLSIEPHTQSYSPLSRPDARKLISRLGWTLPEISREETPVTSSRKPEPQVLEIRKQLEFWLEQFELHIKQAMAYFPKAIYEQPPDPFDQNYNTTIKKQSTDLRIGLSKAQFESEIAKESLKKAGETWPEGRAMFRELSLGTDELLKLIENAKEIDSLLSRNDIFNTIDRIKQLILQNRKHAANADTHFENGLSRLKELTGIDIHIGA